MRKVALLVGNGHFESKYIAPLSAPARDVIELKKVLEHPSLGGFEVKPPLQDRPINELNREIREFFSREKADLLLFYFSGHGFIHDKQLFLATHSTVSEDFTADATHAKDNNISYIDILEWVKKSVADQVIIVLDCCYGGLTDAKFAAYPQMQPFDLQPQQSDEKAPFLLTASDDTHPLAYQDKNGDLSLFTKYLITGIQTGAPDKKEEGIIYLDDLHTYIRDKIYDKQNPQLKYPRTPHPKVPIATYATYRLEITIAQQEDKRIIPNYEIVYDSKRDANSAYLHLDNQPFVIDLPELYTVPPELYPKQHVKIQLWESGKKRKLLTEATVSAQSTPIRVQCIRKDAKAHFEIKPIDDTCKIVGKPRRTAPTQSLPTLATIQPPKLILISYLLDGTMKAENLRVAKDIILDFSRRCEGIGIPIQFGCFVYGEYLKRRDRLGESSVDNLSLSHRKMPYEYQLKDEELTSPNLFSNSKKLEDFLNDIQPQPVFEEQDTADALELAFQYVNYIQMYNQTWQESQKYLVLVGNSYPHPISKDVHEFGVYDLSTSEFHDISWRDELEELKQTVQHRLALWMSNATAYHRFSEHVWREFDTNGEYHKIATTKDADVPLEVIFKQIHGKKAFALDGEILFPFLDEYNEVI